jgi:hypothetical protein
MLFFALNWLRVLVPRQAPPSLQKSTLVDYPRDYLDSRYRFDSYGLWRSSVIDKKRSVSVRAAWVAQIKYVKACIIVPLALPRSFPNFDANHTAASALGLGGMMPMSRS